MKKIIKVEAVEKHFGNQVIIPPLSLDIKEGEFLTILGNEWLRENDFTSYDRRI